MLEVKMFPVNNPRTPDGKWKNMKGCDKCKTVHSAYVRIFIKYTHANGRSTYGVAELCKSCLVEGEEIINKTILKQAEKRVE